MRKPFVFATKLLLVSFIVLCFSTPILAVDGWELIKNNDFVAAKNAFKSKLAQTPNDKDALYGLIFISEVTSDDDSYELHAQQLIDIDWNEYEYRLFGHLHDAEPPEILAKKLSNRAKADAVIHLADSLFYDRRKKQSIGVLRDFIGDYNWSLIGPFQNVAGSGFIKTHAIEKEAYNTEKEYINNKKQTLQWLPVEVRSPKGTINFEEYLPYKNSAVNYANTFIKIPSDRKLQIRIARYSPMKIWLDDDLVFDSKDNTVRRWDNEMVTLDIKAGTHRLLVKQADFYSNQKNRNALSLYYYENHRRRSSGYRFGTSSRKGSYFDFAFRLTDEKGNLYKDITTSYDDTYEKQTYKPVISQKETLHYFKDLAESDKNNLGKDYLLCKAFMKFDKSEDGEMYFVKKQKQAPNSMFYRYLLAKFYAYNGKGERAEKLIAGFDEAKTPIYEMLDREFQKLDEEDDEEDYVAMLGRLLKISPSKWDIVKKYIAHYEKKGMQEEKRKFINDFSAAFPTYKEQLEPYLKEDSYKPSSYKPTTDKEREEAAKKALKRLKSKYSSYDYGTVIRWYKNQEKEKVEKIIGLYDKMIKMEPYDTEHRSEKAEYLFEKGKYDKALVELNHILKIKPYEYKVLETIGDVYHEKKDKQQALKYWKKYKKVYKAAPSRWSSKSSIDSKIEKIEELEKFKDLFDVPSFEAALAGKEWQEKYKDEESVIVLYTVEAELQEDNNLDLNQKLLIKVHTEAGVKYWQEADFSMFGRLEYIRIIKPDGKELTPERRGSYVVFKNLEAGDLIQLEAAYNMNMSYELDNELFFILPLTYEAVIHQTKVELMVPKDKFLQFKCNRISCDSKKRIAKGKDIYTWETFATPKMEKENGVLDQLDMYAWLMMSSLNDWKKVSDWYLNKTYRRLDANYEVQEITDSLVTKEMTDKEKIITLYNYVTKEINYSFVSFLQSSFIPKAPGATCSAKIGDCKDVASLMISMLQHVGIESFYVLVKTRNFTDIEPTPSITFDHVIVGYVLDGKTHYMDLTTDFFPYYAIHEGDSDAWALEIKKGSDKVFRLPNDHLDFQKSRLEVEVTAKFSLDKSVALDVKTKATGVVGGYLKERVHLMTKEERHKFISKYFGQSVFEDLTIEDYKFGDITEITKPLNSEFKFTANKYLDKISRFYVFEIPYMKAASRKSELLPKRRYNNLDLHQIMDIYPNRQVINIEMPEGYGLSEIPKSVKMDNQFFKYSIQYEKTPKGMKVSRDLVYKNRLVKADDFLAFKKAYLDMVEMDNLKLAMER